MPLLEVLILHLKTSANTFRYFLMYNKAMLIMEKLMKVINLKQKSQKNLLKL